MPARVYLPCRLQLNHTLYMTDASRHNLYIQAYVWRLSRLPDIGPTEVNGGLPTHDRESTAARERLWVLSYGADGQLTLRSCYKNLKCIKILPKSVETPNKSKTQIYFRLRPWGCSEMRYVLFVSLSFTCTIRQRKWLNNIMR